MPDSSGRKMIGSVPFLKTAVAIMTSLTAYRLIGNSRSAALVSKQGSIDWCCLPEFHSQAVFSALLENKKGGYFSLSSA